MALHENFREYTADEIAIIKKNVCLKHKCPFLTRVSDFSAKTITNNFCAYIDWMGHSRGCMPDECTHYLDEKPKKRLGNFIKY